MNTHFALAAIALVVAASVNGDLCNKDQSQAAIASMSGLLRLPEVNLCGKKSGFNLMSSKTAPNPTQEDAMCKAFACHTLISLLQSADPPDCEMKIRTSGAALNIKTIVDGFESKCKSPNSTRFTVPPTNPTNLKTGKALPVSVVNSKKAQLSNVANNRVGTRYASSSKPRLAPPTTLKPRLAPPTTLKPKLSPHIGKFSPASGGRQEQRSYEAVDEDYETDEENYETVEGDNSTVEEDREFADPVSAPVSAPKPTKARGLLKCSVS
ncbi:unnamed protein product [Hyaloperonospora brassicae]|uniref:Elicitin-like protein n=1 Tax=Hyaloperonospora brassicae TaxID=162125 RepID=A0AAV0TRR9_HYABA|nr:unnamed protein product [Hyaloperonospora brassicae]